MDEHMFDDLPKVLAILAVVVLAIGIAVGALIAWLVLS